MKTINDKTAAAIRTLAICISDRDLGSDAKAALEVVRAEFLADELAEPKSDFAAALAIWIEKAQAIVDEGYQGCPNLHPKLEVMKGRRYLRIVRADEGQRSAYCFIDTRNGDVLKPAGWKGPAKHARGNIYTDRVGVSAHGALYL